ncbi:fructose-1,6-bisphosphatase [Enterococcus songbeiensis]|uniref:fructose-1,6-bisphosphatase n=1 Tax=Enterococcus songbeiensis TaxID=2559927 RepID=UPI0010F97267|nr:fructose-1,6-bisphosphatase [Enterococcus songbeiensis]
MEEKYLHLLKEKFATKEAVLTELINLEAIHRLPKGTEHFVSDIHGEFAAFDHVLRNGSGSVKEKVRECFPTFSEEQLLDLCTLIYYPEEKMKQLQLSPEKRPVWFRQQLLALLRVTNYAGRKYTRSKVRKTLPPQFAYILEELLSEVEAQKDKIDYFEGIITKLIALEQAEALIVALSYTIQRLVVDHLHVVGDIFDRGPKPDAIIERLMQLPSVDIQWGNHDLIWLAAVAGSPVAMMNVIRICARYNNLALLEDSYGINLRPLLHYSKRYTVSPAFDPKFDDVPCHHKEERKLLNQVQQAAAILQFKLEGQLIQRRPCFLLQQRNVLERIHFPTQRIHLDSGSYPLTDFYAPTIDPTDPTALTEEENQLIQRLLASFQQSEKLTRHTDFLMEKGGMYLCFNNNLLFHGCIPLHENGDLKSLRIEGINYAGKDLLDYYEQQIRKSYHEPEKQTDLATDLLWYLWMGECSSLFGKEAMTTFERYYLKDSHTHYEKKNAYYRLRKEEQTCREILTLFGLPESGHIINGHTPVQEKNGENPIKANGKLIVIDGGYAKGYQKKTGIAGYTLLANSYGIQLAAHQPFTSVADAVTNGTDILSVLRLVAVAKKRTTVKDTTIGKTITQEIADLEKLYRQFDML